MKPGIRCGVIALLAAALLACAAQSRRELAQLPGKRACFWTRNVFAWRVLDPSTLIVEAPSPNNDYLVKLFAPIPDLKFNARLGFEASGGEPGLFCRDNGYIVALGPIAQREPVLAVHALDADEAKQLLAQGAVRRTNPPFHRPGPPPVVVAQPDAVLPQNID